jgi:hypothetical protein
VATSAEWQIQNTNGKSHTKALRHKGEDSPTAEVAGFIHYLRKSAVKFFYSRSFVSIRGSSWRSFAAISFPVSNLLFAIRYLLF